MNPQPAPRCHPRGARPVPVRRPVARSRHGASPGQGQPSGTGHWVRPTRSGKPVASTARDDRRQRGEATARARAAAQPRAAWAATQRTRTALCPRLRPAPAITTSGERQSTQTVRRTKAARRRRRPAASPSRSITRPPAAKATGHTTDAQRHPAATAAQRNPQPAAGNPQTADSRQQTADSRQQNSTTSTAADRCYPAFITHSPPPHRTPPPSKAPAPEQQPRTPPRPARASTPKPSAGIQRNPRPGRPAAFTGAGQLDEARGQHRRQVTTDLARNAAPQRSSVPSPNQAPPSPGRTQPNPAGPNRT